MVQVNLIGKKRKDKFGKSWVVILVLSLFVSFVLYFLGSAVYVVTKLSFLNSEIKKVDEESVLISGQISSNKESLTKFVLSKFTLDRIALLKKERFRYKEYLDQITKFIPISAVLTNVDFATKGWIAVSVSLPGLNPLRELENNLTTTNRLSQTEFVSVFSESVSRDKSGAYNMKLHFEIKPNGGK